MASDILQTDPKLAELQKQIEAERASRQEKTKQEATTATDKQDYSFHVLSNATKPVWDATSAMTICSVFLVFSLIILGLATYLLKIGKSTDSVLKIFGTILIITIACFLILAGYDDKQITPVIGLLGTLAGYLLGKESSRSTNPPPP